MFIRRGEKIRLPAMLYRNVNKLMNISDKITFLTRKGKIDENTLLIYPV